MRCIKTGCLAYLVEYGEYVYGDAFESARGDLVIRCVWAGRDPSQFPTKRHFTVEKIDEWFDRDKTNGIQRQSTVVAKLATNHGYEGVDESALTEWVDGD